MDLGTALALGYNPTGYPRYGQNPAVDWSQVSGGYAQPFPPDMYTATPQQSLAQGMSAFTQPLPMLGIPRRVASIGAPAAAQPEPLMQPEPQQDDVGKQLGGWQPGKPFKIESYYPESPDEKVTVRSFEPGKQVVLESKLYGREILDPNDPADASEYQKIASRFSQLNDLYKQYQAQQGGYQLTPTGQDPMLEQGYNYRVNLGGRELPFKVEGDAAYIYDQGKRRRIDWTDIDPGAIKPVSQQAAPIEESFTSLRRNLGRNINDPLAETEAALNTGFSSAPYQSSLIENVGVVIGDRDPQTGVPNVSFEWKGPGAEPAGYIQKVQQKWQDDVNQLKSNAQNFTRGLEAQPESVVNSYLQGIDNQIASIREQASATTDPAQAKELSDKALQLLDRRETIATTRMIPVNKDQSILEAMPQNLKSSINPNSWEGMLALGSGFGWEDQRTGGSTGPVFTTEELAKRAITQAAMQTPLQTTSTNLSKIQRTVNPMLKELKSINEEGIEEYKSDWSNVSQQPATFTYEYNGEDVVVQKPIAQAVREFNSAVGAVNTALESGDATQIAYAKANLDAKGRLFSGTITPPGGLSTRSIKNGNALSDLSTNFQITEEDRPYLAGRIYGGSIMPKLTAPELTVVTKPARAEKEPKRYVPAYPGVVLGNAFIPRQSQTLFQAITATDDASKFAAAALSPARAQSTGQTWLANAVLDDDKSGMGRGQAEKHKGIIEKANVAIAKDTPASAEMRRSITRSSLKQLENMGIKVPSEDLLLDSLENIYKAARSGDQRQLQNLTTQFQANYLNPNSPWYKTVYDKFKNSGIGSRLTTNLDSTIGWQSTDKNRRLQKVPALFESIMNRLDDTLYLYRNSGQYQTGVHTRNLSSEVGSVPIRWIVNPWNQSEQSIATFPSAANQIGESVLQGGKDVVAKINKKEDPDGAIAGKYDPAASFGIATLNDYSPTVGVLRGLFSVDPSIQQDIRSMTKQNHQTDMKARNSLRDNADAFTNEPAYESSYDAYLEALLGGSIMPRNRIFNR